MNADADHTNPILKNRATVNPYRIAAGMVMRRLNWDLRIQSWISRRLVQNWENRYVGKKAVIVCNGPSLNKTDLSKLDGVFTFGLNKINLIFGRSDFRPSCIVAVNPFVIQQNSSFFNETSIPLFIDTFGATTGQISKRRNVAFLHTAGQGFAKNCSWNVPQGHTVTYVAMQLAFHMGFSEIALVGCDHNFAVKGPSNQTVSAIGKDESHFDPNYFADGAQWQLPDLEESEASYRRANRIYNAYNRKIVNATVGGNLEIFNRTSLDDFLAH